MDILPVTDNNTEQLIAERDNCLLSIISSFNDGDNSKLLENLQQSVKYLPTYDVLSIDEELLQYIMPAVKRCLQKIYEDNFLLSDTVDDDIVINILKENLQVALGFIHIMKTILEFFLENTDINLNSLNQVPLNLAELMLLNFDHIKNSTDVYKNTFNMELLEIFRIMQDIHMLFLRLLESHIIIKKDSNFVDQISVLNQVLDIICNISEVLFDMNVKSMGNNWKGYTAIVQKFSILLSDTIDLKRPIHYLILEINRNLSSIGSLDEVDLKLFPQLIKVTGFLIKVALKIFDIFWNCLERVSREILTLCCIIYSYQPDFFQTQGYPADVLDLIENSFCKPLEPFLYRLVNDPVFLKIFSSENISSCECSFGSIIFFSNILKLLVLTENKIKDFRIDVIIRTIFNSTNMWYIEFFWASQPENSIFDNLILNITASVLIYDECFAEVESILLQNVLQEHVWSAILAVEVWTLLLCNSTPQTCLETLLSLMKKHKEIEFGVYTCRLEQIYLKCLMRRIFKMLPVHMKNDVVQRLIPIKNVQSWKMIGFHNFPVQQKFAIEDICVDVVNEIQAMKMETFDFSLKDISLIADNLEVLSTVNFNTTGVNATGLVHAVHSLWEFDVNCNDLTNNNMFKHFLNKLSKVTSNLMVEFSNRQLITVLTQLKALSTDDLYKLLACDILLSLSKRTIEYSQDGYKINTLVADVIYPNLLRTKKGVIKQNTLEVFHALAINGKSDIVKNIMIAAKDMQGDISNYLQRNVTSNKFDKQYYALLESFTFHHQCIIWKTEVCQPRLKKPKINGFAEETNNIKEKPVSVRTEICKAIETEKEMIQSNDISSKTENVTEVIGNIRGEVKCLFNVLKTEQLSKKNATDIKLIANQLLSLL